MGQKKYCDDDQDRFGCQNNIASDSYFIIKKINYFFHVNKSPLRYNKNKTHPYF